jgi:Uma2 family endonuclease
MATTQTSLVTAEQFMEMDLDDGNYELVRGEVILLSLDNYHHAFVAAKIGRLLGNYGDKTGYGYALSGDFAVRTERNPDTVRGADVAFYSNARLPYSSSLPGLPEIPPDLAVEVYSPSNRASEMRVKVNEYLDVGVLMVWVVHPNRRNVVIYRVDDPIPTVLTQTDVLENLPELPGFRCAVSDFFA